VDTATTPVIELFVRFVDDEVPWLPAIGTADLFNHIPGGDIGRVIAEAVGGGSTEPSILPKPIAGNALLV
jgi:hypothetical protein